MDKHYRFLEVESVNGIATITLRRTRFAEPEIIELTEEILQAAKDRSAPRVILDFEGKSPQCLYSIFLAKLVSIQRKLTAMNGGLRLCNCNSEVQDIFKACCLDQLFDMRGDCENPEQGWD